VPRKIVEEYTSVYRKKFMFQTLGAIPGEKMKTDAFLRIHERLPNEKEGFLSEIIVSFDGVDHPKVWAANMVLEDDKTGVRTGVITVAQTLVVDITKGNGKEILKEVLAEEWLEVMMKLRDGTDEAKTVREKEELIMLFSSLKRPALWQDTTEREQELHHALRRLLVPTLSLCDDLRKTFGLTFEQIRGLCKTDTSRASSVLRNFAKTYSANWSVDYELVFDRIREVLFSAPNG
jgi:hypothetical protein